MPDHRATPESAPWPAAIALQCAQGPPRVCATLMDRTYVAANPRRHPQGHPVDAAGDLSVHRDGRAGQGADCEIFHRAGGLGALCRKGRAGPAVSWPRPHRPDPSHAVSADPSGALGLSTGGNRAAFGLGGVLRRQRAVDTPCWPEGGAVDLDAAGGPVRNPCYQPCPAVFLDADRPCGSAGLSAAGYAWQRRAALHHQVFLDGRGFGGGTLCLSGHRHRHLLGQRTLRRIPRPVDRDRRACDRGGGSLCLASGNRRPAGIDEPARMAEKLRFQPAAFASNLVLRGVIWALLAIPYRWRIPLAGWVVSRILSPVAGYGKRVRANLALIFPDMPQAEVARMVRAVPDNAGRTLVEVYSGAEFKAKVADSRITGAGLSAILQARDRGQGVILVSGHFGNYDVPRAVLSAQGHLVGALYKPFSNPFFDKHYRRTISAIGTPIFPRGRRGLAEMVQHLRAGGLLGILIDQSIEHGAPLTFFGKRARTALSAAELALKYNCLLVPVYGVRQPDGLSFELVIEDPIPASTPEKMTQSLNDSLEPIALSCTITTTASSPGASASRVMGSVPLQSAIFTQDVTIL